MEPPHLVCSPPPTFSLISPHSRPFYTRKPPTAHCLVRRNKPFRRASKATLYSSCNSRHSTPVVSLRRAARQSARIGLSVLAFCTAYCDAALRIYPIDVERALTSYVSPVTTLHVVSQTSFSDDAAQLVVALANDMMRRISRGIVPVNSSLFTRNRNGIDITDYTRIMFSEFDFSSDLDRISDVAVTAVFVDGSGR